MWRSEFEKSLIGLQSKRSIALLYLNLEQLERVRGKRQGWRDEGVREEMSFCCHFFKFFWLYNKVRPNFLCICGRPQKGLQWHSLPNTYELWKLLHVIKGLCRWDQVKILVWGDVLDHPCGHWTESQSSWGVLWAREGYQDTGSRRWCEDGAGELSHVIEVLEPRSEQTYHRLQKGRTLFVSKDLRSEHSPANTLILAQRHRLVSLGSQPVRNKSVVQPDMSPNVTHCH